MKIMLWSAAGLLLLLAALAGLGDWQRRRRRDLDRIGPLDWATVQMLAFIAAALLAFVAVRF